ncbi:MAG: adenosylcobinamide-phosphate synthase CbiB [Sulfurimonas sp.]|nr:adenosylcobinamide-phosphate synthase CbiB [Sulfurimonas sp.]
MFIAHNMLRTAVLGVTTADDKHQAISMLVSRDTEDLSQSDIYKAAIETYGENLSDGVIAPLFFLLLFGLPGVVFYKTVNTLDSMVGYRNEKYENYGKVSAILDDILNFIPSRLTALLIMFLGKQKNLFAFYKDGKKHDSPNAGHPITAMALVLGLKLGGDTSYFGKIKKKATFGEGRESINAEDVRQALAII